MIPTRITPDVSPIVSGSMAAVGEVVFVVNGVAVGSICAKGAWLADTALDRLKNDKMITMITAKYARGLMVFFMLTASIT